MAFDSILKVCEDLLERTSSSGLVPLTRLFHPLPASQVKPQQRKTMHSLMDSPLNEIRTYIKCYNISFEKSIHAHFKLKEIASLFICSFIDLFLKW